MLSHVLSGAVLGINGYLVRVETDVGNGLPAFATVGLPQGAVKEGKERVVAAIHNSGFQVPPRKITINLAPADIRKEGTAFDLPIAIGILVSTGQIRSDRLESLVLLGELGLDGTLRPIRGALPVAVAAREANVRGLVLPVQNVREAAVAANLDVYGARTLQDVVGILADSGWVAPARSEVRRTTSVSVEGVPDFAEVAGQSHAKRALEVAAAGSHNVLLTGPPGAGKTMLVRRLAGILPPMTLDESLETTKVHSVAGILSRERPLVENRPFRAPHHTISDAGLIGGGSSPRPGEVSLAHNGVLFLDELPEFRRHVLEVLRQPLEDYEVTIARAGTTLVYPARFLLAAAMNPCPCGFAGSRRGCVCPPAAVQRYLAKLSGPLLDRIDIHLEVPPVDREQLLERGKAENSAAIRRRVLRARERQHQRFHSTRVRANAHLSSGEVRQFCRLDRAGESMLRNAVASLGFSARAYHRVLKISGTIADLAGCERIAGEHVAEAIQYRSVDRRPSYHRSGSDLGGGYRR